MKSDNFLRRNFGIINFGCVCAFAGVVADAASALA